MDRPGRARRAARYGRLPARAAGALHDGGRARERAGRSRRRAHARAWSPATAGSTCSASTSSATSTSTRAGPNCSFRSSLRGIPASAGGPSVRSERRWRSPPTPRSRSGVRPSPTPASPPRPSTGSRSAPTSSRPAASLTACGPPRPRGEAPRQLIMTTGGGARTGCHSHALARGRLGTAGGASVDGRGVAVPGRLGQLATAVGGVVWGRDGLSP